MAIFHTATALVPIDTTSRQRTPKVELSDVSVRFGSTVALDGVTVDLRPGERHAIVGENGAGKSTLMKVLFGLLTPDRGSVFLDGTRVELRTPADALTHGIGMVQQHFELIPSFTVAENILLGSEIRKGPAGILDYGKSQETISTLAQETGLPIDPAIPVRDLSVAAQQRVEILKALYREARVLILDEPTAVLAPSEAADLWKAVRRLSERGVTVVFITHKLDEVMANADRVTVLRQGKRILTSPIAETTPEALAAAMVGTAPEVSSPPTSPVVASAPAVPSHPVLTLKKVSVAGNRGEASVDGVSLTVHAGEIVGLAGVDGSGQVELLEAILGIRAVTSGKMRLEDWDITAFSVAKRRSAGIAFIPEDRHRQAVSLPLPCEENMVLGREGESAFSRWGWLKRGSMNELFARRRSEFDVRGGERGKPIRALSGGNQQKLVLARELSRSPRLLVASQPTRGLDFGATAFVHETLRQESRRGAAVIVQSLDLAEVLALSDRVAVMLRGKIVAVLNRSEATEARVGQLMTAVSPRDSAESTESVSQTEPATQPAPPAAPKGAP
ncbi:MAG: ABC transporter ATP-binding protein [Armatimonadaceae bacterium]